MSSASSDLHHVVALSYLIIFKISSCNYYCIFQLDICTSSKLYLLRRQACYSEGGVAGKQTSRCGTLGRKGWWSYQLNALSDEEVGVIITMSTYFMRTPGLDLYANCIERVNQDLDWGEIGETHLRVLVTLGDTRLRSRNSCLTRPTVVQ